MALLLYFGSGPSLVLIICGVALGLLVTLYRYRLQIRPDPIPRIPYNAQATSRFLGDIHELKDTKYRRPWVLGQPKRHGSALAQLFIHPFEKPTVVVSDYREVVDILCRRTKEFDRGTRNKECVGLIAPNFHMTMESRDPRFKVHKELLRDLMTPAFLHEVTAPRLYERSKSLIDLWTLKINKGHGRPFSTNRDFHLATLDIICSAAFGLDEDKGSLRRETSHLQSFCASVSHDENSPIHFPDATPDPDVESLLNIADIISISQSSPFPYLAQYLALLKPKNAMAWWYRRRLVHRQTTKRVEKLRAGTWSSHECALDLLLWREMSAAKKVDRKPDFYSPDVRDELIGYLLGGHDTTASTMSWWGKYMSRHQRVQERLRFELHQAHRSALHEDRLPTVKEITSTSIPYLDAVMEETIRYASVATMIVRTALCDTEILGYPIPKGVNVILPLTGPSFTEPALPVPEHERSAASQRDKGRVPAWGDDAGEYIPERWLRWDRGTDGIATQVFNPNAGPNLGFSTGPRQCFGKRLAYLQMRVLMTLLIWSFELAPLASDLNSDEVIENMVNLPQDSYVKLRRL